MPKEKLKVGIVSLTFFYVPLWAARDHGFFEAENLDVELSMLGNASQVEPLQSGALHALVGTCEAALQNAAAGGPLRVVAGNTGKLSHSLIVHSRFKRIEDMKGATFGILNMTEGSFFQLKEMLSKHGLQYPGDYTVKETGGVPPRHKALLAGTIDGGLQSIPWNYVAEDAGFLSLGDVIDYVPQWQFVSVNVSKDWAEANRDVLVRFLRALSRATEWVYTHKVEAASIAERELPTRRDYAERAWDYYTSTNALTRDLSVNVEGMKKVIATQKAAGLLPQSAPDGLEAYVAGEYLREARAGM